MLKLYEGMIFLPRAIPECTLVEIIHTETVRILPTDAYLIPVNLHHRAISDNLCLQGGNRSLMTVNYIKTYKSKESEGILSYREFQDVEITKQKILRSDIYEVNPPFEIEEYFDGTFLFFRLNRLFNGDEVGDYRLYSEKNEHVEDKGSVYKIYPDRSCVLEYVIFGEGFIYRFKPKVACEYPFYFKYWTASDTLYFVAKSGGAVLQIECPDSIDSTDAPRSDTSKGSISMPLDEFVRRGGFLYVGTHKVGFSPEFYKYYSV